MTELTKCKQIEECPDCFARVKDGGCKALGNTDFFKQCPFYKTKEQQMKELKELAERGR